MLKQLITFFFTLAFGLEMAAQERPTRNNGSNELSPPKSVLFVHFDKTVYTNNEDVWFTAYLLKNNPLLKYDAISVSLVNDLDRSVVMENRFVLENGLAFGKVIIPEAAPPGKYTLLVVTNVLKNSRPDVIFTQPILIRSAELQEIIAVVEPLDTAASLPQQKVRLTVTFKNPSISIKDKAAEAQLSYYVGNASHPVFKGFGKTKNGIYDLMLPSAKLTNDNNTLHIQLWYNNKVMELGFNLPAKPTMPLVNFYPEGGHLVEGMENNIAWEVKTNAGQPVMATGFLLKDGKVVDTVINGSAGIGRFKMFTTAGSKYSLKLYGQTDTSYSLPTADRGGPMLSLPRAMINDTLLVNIRTTQRNKYQLIAHNNKELFFVKSLELDPGINRLKFVLKNIPRGICQLVLTDSAGHLLADRLFFAHYYDQPTITINTDKTSYHSREKVSIRLKLNSADSAEVSIAGVQTSRLKKSPFTNIRNYVYLTNEFADIPPNTLGETNTNDELLETLLMIRKWKALDWKTILTTPVIDTANNNYKYISFKGRINYLNKPLEKPALLVSIVNPNLQFNTDADGSFALSDEFLRTEHEGILSFVIANDKATNYGVSMIDPYAILIERLAASLELNDDFDTPARTNYLYVPDNEHAIKLKEVNIRSRKDDAYYNGSSLANQSLERIEVPRVTTLNGKPWNYSEILLMPSQNKSFVLQVKGIQHINEDEKALFSPTSSDPLYHATIFWNHHKNITSTSDTELSFYTGDITGEFKIIVQGRTPSGVVYGEASFDVKK